LLGSKSTADVDADVDAAFSSVVSDDDDDDNGVKRGILEIFEFEFAFKLVYGSNNDWTFEFMFPCCCCCRRR